MAKIQLETGEIKELLERTSSALDSLLDLCVCLGGDKDFPAADRARQAADKLEPLSNCLSGILRKDRFSINDL